MTGLNNEKCEACRRDSPHVTDEEVAQLQPEIPDWELTHENGIPKLDRVFKFKDFQCALDFTTELGSLAEDQGHHPDIYLAWGKVGVKIWTHKIDGLSESDFILAAKIDRLNRT